MSRYYFSLVLIISFFSIQAQEYPLKKGAKIVVAQNSIIVESDQLIELPVEILRSKTERRTKFAMPTIQNIEGLVSTISATNQADQFILTLDPTGLPNGDYTLIIKGSGQFKRYLTSTMISLKVSREPVLMVKND